jgi:hypothetical protein
MTSIKLIKDFLYFPMALKFGMMQWVKRFIQEVRLLTFKYNIAGEIRFARGENRLKAFLKVYHGELERTGKCNLKPENFVCVRDPHQYGNKVFNQLRHL